MTKEAQRSTQQITAKRHADIIEKYPKKPTKHIEGSTSAADRATTHIIPTENASKSATNIMSCLIEIPCLTISKFYNRIRFSSIFLII